MMSAVWASLVGTAACAAEDVDSLARDAGRLEALRAAKDVQRSYAQLAQFGRWKDMAALFTPNARLVDGAESVDGRIAIAAWLQRRGGGHPGLAPGAFDSELIEEPLVNLSTDGNSAKGRWMSLSLLGDGKGKTRIESGIYENEYVRDGRSWKISLAHYYPQFVGDYENGWKNAGGADLALVPFHFSLAESGTPVLAAADAAPASGQTLAAVEARVAALNDEDAVRNLQNAYGYYVDRRMWNDVSDLFAEGGFVDLGGGHRFTGRAGIREAMESMGPAGLKHGELNDRPLFDTLVQVLPGGREAVSRGLEVGMVGAADQHTANWEFRVFRNRFVKEGDIWKLEELHYYPILKADYFTGWGKVAASRAGGRAAPAFLDIQRNGPAAQGDDSGTAAQERLTEARRKLNRSLAYDGTENVSSAYGFYIDHQQLPEMSGIFAERGTKQFPSIGYYVGRDRIFGGDGRDLAYLRLDAAVHHLSLAYSAGDPRCERWPLGKSAHPAVRAANWKRAGRQCRCHIQWRHLPERSDCTGDGRVEDLELRE